MTISSLISRNQHSLFAKQDLKILRGSTHSIWEVKCYILRVEKAFVEHDSGSRLVYICVDWTDVRVPPGTHLIRTPIFSQEGPHCISQWLSLLGLQVSSANQIFTHSEWILLQIQVLLKILFIGAYQ